jgi:pantoate--beta-alanine ligase
MARPKMAERLAKNGKLMEVLTKADEFRQYCEHLRGSGPVGLVLTMGALHDGHASLIEVAKKHATSVVATVFVNPTQFGPSEDFARYPRDLERDAGVCQAAGASVLFAPTPQQMYPDGEQTRVHVGKLATGLCGAMRPGHFEGVCTVVTKFFALCGPCVAVFGEKDYQQLKVIERTVTDLLLPVTVIGAKTLRDVDGLAMSSRNRYLSAEDRQRALSLVAALRECARLYDRGERRVSVLEAAARALLESTQVEYVSLVDSDTLELYPEVVDANARLLIAARVEKTRLIDNCSLATGPAQ